MIKALMTVHQTTLTFDNGRGNEGDCDIYDNRKWGYVPIFEEVQSAASSAKFRNDKREDGGKKFIIMNYSKE